MDCNIFNSANCAAQFTNSLKFRTIGVGGGGHPHANGSGKISVFFVQNCTHNDPVGQQNISTYHKNFKIIFFASPKCTIFWKSSRNCKCCWLSIFHHEGATQLNF